MRLIVAIVKGIVLFSTYGFSMRLRFVRRTSGELFILFIGFTKSLDLLKQTVILQGFLTVGSQTQLPGARGTLYLLDVASVDQLVQ